MRGVRRGGEVVEGGMEMYLVGRFGREGAEEEEEEQEANTMEKGGDGLENC